MKFTRCLFLVGLVLSLLSLSDMVRAEDPPKLSESHSATSLTDSLQGESGVAIQTMCTNCNSADLSLGGLNNEYVSLTCDGIPVPPGLAQIYLLSVMPPSAIFKVSVDRGASLANLEGAGIGGSIQIQRVEPKEGIDGDVAIDVGSDGWRSSRGWVSGRRGWLGGFLIASSGTSNKIDANNDGNPDDPAFRRKTLEGGFDLKLGRHHRLRLTASTYGETQRDNQGGYFYDFSDTERTTHVYELEDVDFQRKQYDARYRGLFENGSQLTVTLMTAKRNENIRETNGGPMFPKLPTYYIEDERTQGAVSYKLPLGVNGSLEFGAGFMNQKYGIVDVMYNFLQLTDHGMPPEEAWILAQTLYQHEKMSERGLWAQGEWALGPTLTLTGGLRQVKYEYTDEETRPLWNRQPLPEGNKLLPRIGLQYKPRPEITLRASLGSGYRQPGGSYEEVCCGRRYRGNRGIEMETGQAVLLEGVFQPNPATQLSLGLNITNFDDMVIKLNTLPYYFRSTIQNVNVPKARLASLSLEGKTKLSQRLSFKGSFTLLKADNRSPGDKIPALIDFFGVPTWVNFRSADLPYFFERQGVLGFDLLLGRGASLSVSGQYKGPMTIERMSADPSEYNPDTYAQATFFEKTEPFWVVNTRGSIPLTKEITFYFGVDNITDYIQADRGNPQTDYTWGPLRGRYLYGGVSFKLD